jgi:hypothetical protein
MSFRQAVLASGSSLGFTTGIFSVGASRVGSTASNGVGALPRLAPTPNIPVVKPRLLPDARTA